MDTLVYAAPEVVQRLSTFARSSRNAQVQILVKDTKTAIATGHPLPRLAQRLPSKILIRKMTLEPNNKEMGFMLGDTDKLLYKNDESLYPAFLTVRPPVK